MWWPGHQLLNPSVNSVNARSTGSGTVTAYRIGAKTFSPDQLKVIQEVITLAVFGVFSTFYFGDKLHWNHFAAFGCLVAGAFFMFHKF